MGKFTARQWQNCATCEFWRGPRELDAVQKAADLDPSAQGPCVRNGTQVKRYATSSCISWKAWTAFQS